MIFHTSLISAGPGIGGIFYGAGLWVLGTLIVLFHPAGIQVIGGVIAIIGFIMLLIHPQITLALSLLLIGFILHSFGRLLVHIRRRG